jgi:Fe-S-cluster containining protein
MAKAMGMFDVAAGTSYYTYSQPVACKPGCAHCCCVEVVVHTPEVELLVRHIRDRLTPEQIADLKRRMNAVLAERKEGRRPRCALLGADERCTVYEVRPLKCRAANARDSGPCKKYEDEGGDDPLRAFALPHLLADYTHHAVNMALNPRMTPATAPRPRELMSALLKAL